MINLYDGGSITASTALMIEQHHLQDPREKPCSKRVAAVSQSQGNIGKHKNHSSKGNQKVQHRFQTTRHAGLKGGLQVSPCPHCNQPKKRSLLRWGPRINQVSPRKKQGQTTEQAANKL